MNDYREVGVLSDQAMSLLYEESEPYPRHYSGALAYSRFFYPLAHGQPLRVIVPETTRCSAFGMRWGLPCSTVNDTSWEGTVSRPEVLCPCIPMEKWDIRLRYLVGSGPLAS